MKYAKFKFAFVKQKKTKNFQTIDSEIFKDNINEFNVHFDSMSNKIQKSKHNATQIENVVIQFEDLVNQQLMFFENHEKLKFFVMLNLNFCSLT